MNIRPAVPADISELKRLIRQLGYEISEEDIAHNLQVYIQVQGCVYIAEADNGVAGFVSGVFLPVFHAHETMFRITALCVAENSRGKGTGRALVEAVENACLQMNCYYMEVTSGAHRKGDAHVFYERLGYKAYEGKRFLKRLPQP